MSDGVLKRPLKVDMQTFGPKIQPLAESRASTGVDKEKAAGAAFLSKAAAEAGAKKTASGAIVKALKEGTGATPTAASTVKVHYHGTLPDGTVFDSSVKRGEPIEFPLKHPLFVLVDTAGDLFISQEQIAPTFIKRQVRRLKRYVP